MEYKLSIGDIIEAKVFKKDNFGIPYNPLTGNCMPLFSNKEEYIRGLVVDFNYATPVIKELAKPTNPNDRTGNSMKDYMYDQETIKVVGCVKEFDRAAVEDLIKDKKAYLMLEYDLRGADLSGIELSPKDIDFSYIDLQGANLSNTRLRNIDFSNANLSGTDLSRGNFGRSIFIKANFAGAKLLQTNFRDANLNQANLIKADLSSSKITGANLTNTNLADANMSKLNLSRVTLKNTILHHTNLSNINFSNCDIRPKLRFNRCNLGNCIFSDADLSSIEFEDSNLENARFSNVNLSGGAFITNNLSNAKFENADLSKARIISEKLSGVVLDNVNFFNALIMTTDFSESDITGGTTIPVTYGSIYGDIQMNSKQIAEILRALSSVRCNEEKFDDIRIALRNFAQDLYPHHYSPCPFTEI